MAAPEVDQDSAAVGCGCDRRRAGLDGEGAVTLPGVLSLLLLLLVALALDLAHWLITSRRARR